MLWWRCWNVVMLWWRCCDGDRVDDWVAEWTIMNGQFNDEVNDDDDGDDDGANSRLVTLMSPSAAPDKKTSREGCRQMVLREELWAWMVCLNCLCRMSKMQISPGVVCRNGLKTKKK